MDKEDKIWLIVFIALALLLSAVFAYATTANETQKPNIKYPRTLLEKIQYLGQPQIGTPGHGINNKFQELILWLQLEKEYNI